MNPLLATPDVLHVRPYDGAEIRRGDVVVFPSPDGDCKVVHRVLSVDRDGVRTKGDNNRHVDPWIVNPADIIGRVEWIERGSRRIRICTGVMGTAQALVAKAVRLVGAGVSSLARPVYSGLSRNRVLKKWFAGWMATRIISIVRTEGEELQLLLGRRVIGRRPAGKHCWLIRRPFLLFVDGSSLPQ